MTFMYNVAVIETDRGCLKYLSRLLKENPYINSVNCFYRSEDYLEELKKGTVHIAFIRVDSPRLQGLSLAKATQRVSKATRVVFMSRVKSYAVMAFEERASGYLILPVKQRDLDDVVLNIRRRDYWRRGDGPE